MPSGHSFGYFPAREVNQGRQLPRMKLGHAYLLDAGMSLSGIMGTARQFLLGCVFLSVAPHSLNF